MKLSCPSCAQTLPNLKSSCGQPPVLFVVPTGLSRYYYKCDKCGDISNSVYATQTEAALAWARGEHMVAK